MKMKKLFALGLMLGWALVAIATAGNTAHPGLLPQQAKNVLRRTFNQTIASSAGKTLRIEKMQARVTITAWDRNEISAEAVVEVGDSDPETVKEFLDNTNLTISPETGGAVLLLESPWTLFEEKRTLSKRLSDFFKGRKWNLSYAAAVEIRVPALQALDLANSFGDVAVKGVTGGLVLRNESGAVRVENSGGTLEVDNSFGDVRVADFKGGIDIRNESGGVDLKNIGGAAVVGNSFKDIRFQKIEGPLTVTSESGAVIGDDVVGDCRITASFKTVQVRGLRGRCEIKAESSEIIVDRVDKDAVLENSFRPVTATNIKGGLRIVGGSSPLTIADIGGDAYLKSSFNKIKAERVHGRVTVDGESSGVFLRDIDGDVSIASSFNDVDVSGIGGKLEVRAESARVTAAGVAKDADITTSFNSVEARKIRGGLKVQAESAAVLGEEIGGPIDIRNSFKNVILRKTSGSIAVRGESSAVEISQIEALPAGSRIEIKTSFKPITLSLPEGIGIQGTARTEFGKIEVDFPVYLLNTGDTERKAVKFDSGKPGVTLDLETSAGITVKADGAKLK